MMRPKEPIRLMMVIKRKIRIHLLHSTYGSMKKGMQLRRSIHPQRMNASLLGLRTRRMQKSVKSREHIMVSTASRIVWVDSEKV